MVPKSASATHEQTPMMDVLLVDDDSILAQMIMRGLGSEGWSVTIAPDGEIALRLLEKKTFAAIILDLMLPGMSGVDVCDRLRAQQDTTPILMLSGIGGNGCRIAALELGADDYLAKPFDFFELVARVEALVRRASWRRSQEDRAPSLTCGEINVDLDTLEVTCGDRVVALTPKERGILKLLMEHPGRVMTREGILNAVWGLSEDPLTNIVDVYLSRLRKKLGPSGRFIKTVRGAGYRLAVPVALPFSSVAMDDHVRH